MAYASWSVVFGEQPSASKWNILGTNDASFNDGTGIGTSVIDHTKVAAGAQVQMVYSQSQANSSGTGLIPVDNSIPQSGEGDQYFSLAITPKSATNILVIRMVAMFTNSVDNNLTTALFQDSTANALQASSFRVTAGAPTTVSKQHIMVSGTTSATTFKIRAGGNSAGTTQINQALYGAIGNISSFSIQEIKA